MFRIDDTVKIKATGVVGIITDISNAGGSRVYVIESDPKEDEDVDFIGMSVVIYCTEDEIEKI